MQHPTNCNIFLINKKNQMAQLIKSYPAEPHKNRIVWSGDLETIKTHLNEIEARTKRAQLSKCGTVFTEFVRIDDLTLNTCIYKNMDTNDEEKIYVNYSVTIEELCATDEFKDTLRKRVL